MFCLLRDANTVSKDMPSNQIHYSLLVQISVRYILSANQNMNFDACVCNFLPCVPCAALLRHALRRRSLIFTGNCICDVT